MSLVPTNLIVDHIIMERLVRGGRSAVPEAAAESGDADPR